MSSRVDELQSWHDDWSGLRVAVLGLGVSGFAAADTLAELGAEVLVVTGRTDEERETILRVLGVPVMVATDDDQIPSELDAFDTDLVIASPGYAPHHALIRWAEQQHLPIWSEIELAWRVRDKVAPQKWLMVTGTNGKTTTTQLAAHMAEAAGLRAAPCGNIGVPVLDAIRDPQGFDVLVVEISSFQLHFTHSTSPEAAVVLNIADDHLDWHGDVAAYRRAKGKVYDRTKIACVFNVADRATMELVEAAEVVEGARAIGFGVDVPAVSELGVVEGLLVDRAFLDNRRNEALEITSLEQLRTRGLSARHLVEDVLAASALVRAIGVSVEAIHEALDSFSIDAHRNQLVLEGEITWVDDSKATNAHAADASLHAYQRVVWLVGGQLKGVDLSDLVERHRERLRAAVVLGAEQDEVARVFAEHAPAVPLVLVDPREDSQVMPQAVAAAASLAHAGDTVLLAPAAASYDQFTGYADRGNQFQEAVRGRAKDPHGNGSTGAPGE